MTVNALLNPQELLAKLTVLFVEDDEEIRQQMVQFLSRRFKQVRVACNGKQGLAAFREEKPDIILSDILMPEMDGLSMIRAIRDHHHHIPIIVLTAYNEEQYLLRSIELGIDRYLLKPVNTKSLSEALEKIVSNLWQRKEREEADSYLRLLMDIHPNLLLTTSDDQVVYLNRAFLHRLEVDQLGDFLSNPTGLGELLLDQHGTPLSQAGGLWLHRLEELAQNAPLVYLKNPTQPDEAPLALVVECRQMTPPHCQLFTFADVSAIEGQLKHLEHMAFTDTLTGLANRAMGQKSLTKEINRCQRYNRTFSVILLDVDHFKKVNDTYGHEVGDQVLQGLAGLLQNTVRRSDMVVRWGGEEFLVVLPESSFQDARMIAEKLRSNVAAHTFSTVEHITCSFGVAQFDQTLGMQSLVAKADAALYLAKERGRNRVEPI
ncbi:MAG: diguanylate cyclase [Magnetococcales bacterium]|nr:diguanylate cyclase [Magnetococcales bacterium]